MGRRKSKRSHNTTDAQTAQPARVTVSLAHKLETHQQRLKRDLADISNKSEVSSQRIKPQPPSAEVVGDPPASLHAPSTEPPTTADQQPPVMLSPSDRVMLDRALAGVLPLTKKQGSKVPRTGVRSRVDDTADRHAELLARARLGALVGGGTNFVVARDADGCVQGRRSDLKPAVMDILYSARWHPQATLDLHGHRSEEAAVALSQFVRAQKKRGILRVLIVHGKGRHSEGGIGVLDGTVVYALTEGGAAPLVQAFSTARRNLGGTGALMVQLRND